MMKIRICILSALLASVFIFNNCTKKQYTVAEAKTAIEKLFYKTVDGSKKVNHGILCVHSDKVDLHLKLSRGTSFGKAIGSDTPFHSASVGKTHLVALAMRLHEQGKLNINDKAADYLPKALMEGIFTINEKDCSGEVTILQLMNHTSGAADYYENTPKGVRNIKTIMVEEPQKIWSPDETLAFAAKYLTAVGKPGEKFHYSDTGYDLLGFVLERAGGKPLHVLLNEEILVPQGLIQTKWIFYENIDKEPLFPETYVADREVSRNKSVSISWGGGNLLVTAEDLIRFQRALVKGKIIKPTSLALLMENPHRFVHGMDYSCGLFHLQVNKMSFGLLPKSHFLWGNMGSTATFMFYNPAYDVYLAGAFNNSEFMSKQVQFLIKTVDIISKIK